MSERTDNAIEQFAEAHARLTANELKFKNKMRDEDIDCVRSYRREVKKLLGRINTYNSYRELSLAITKLEEAEMWLSKLIKEGGKR